MLMIRNATSSVSAVQRSLIIVRTYSDVSSMQDLLRLKSLEPEPKYPPKRTRQQERYGTKHAPRREGKDERRKPKHSSFPGREREVERQTQRLAYVPRREREEEFNKLGPNHSPRRVREGESTGDDKSHSHPFPRGNRYSQSSRPQARKPPPDKLLAPYELSRRLRRLCSLGQFDDAVLLLKNMPLDAQNVAVWNTLMLECMKERKYKMAWGLYVDMKKRGFTPGSATYALMLMGYSRIQNWTGYTAQLANADKVFEDFLEYVQVVKEHDPNNPELRSNVYTAYITILGASGQYQKMFDVYYSMDEEGRLAANHYTYASLFFALAERKGPSTVEGMNIYEQNASDTRVLWRQMIKISQKSPDFEIDAHVIAGALLALSRGRPSDQLFAFDIARDHLGLAKPGEEPIPAQVTLNHHVLMALFRLCNAARKYRLCIHYAQQIMDRPSLLGDPSILDRHHIEEVLKAYANMAAIGSMNESIHALEKLQWLLKQHALNRHRLEPGKRCPYIPTRHTYTLVLTACWRGADWHSATRAFELMTGYHADDFLDGREAAPRIDARSKGRNLTPDVASMSCIARAALSSGNRAHMRQCLRIIDHLGFNHFFPDDQLYVPPKESNGDGTYLPEAKHAPFYAEKLADVLVDLVMQVVVKGDEERFTPEEAKRWKTYRTRAKDMLRRQQPGSKIVPNVEEQPLGSARGLQATENHIDYERTLR